MKDQLGKVDRGLVDQFIKQHSGYKRREVLAGPQFGVDVSLIDLHQGQAMAMASDPLSLIPTLGLEESAWLSVQLLANDIATTGFAPMYGQFVLNLPAHFSKEDFKSYWRYIHLFSERLGVSITGGHTGFIEGQNSTIAGGGTLITIAEKDKMLLSKFAQIGDSILVTKSCGISSAAILALSFPETVKNKLGLYIHDQACESFYQTSSLLDATTAIDHSNNDVTAMHDVTEGGVLGAIFELAIASDNGATIDNALLPINEVQSSVCNLFSLDARTCIGAGSMIITCKAGTAPSVINRLSKKDIPCVEVGKMTHKIDGIKLVYKNDIIDLHYQSEDPYWAAFFKAYQIGWK